MGERDVGFLRRRRHTRWLTAVSQPANTTGQTQSFTVKNNGSATATFNLSPTCTGIASGCSSPLTVNLGAGAQSGVSVSYNVGAVGTGVVKLLATHSTNSAVKDTGWVNVTSSTYGVAVTPDGTTVLQPANSSGRSQSFTVKNSGTASGTFNLTSTCTSPATGCSTPAPVTLAAGAQSAISITYGTGTAGNGKVKLLAALSTNSAVKDTGWVNVVVGAVPQRCRSRT